MESLVGASVVCAGLGGGAGAGLRRAGAFGAAFLLPTAELMKAGMLMRDCRVTHACKVPDAKL